jgi:ABC-type iron transport system FetAB ATPase subunit
LAKDIILSCKGLIVSRGGGARKPIIDGVSVDLPGGEWIDIAGTSGVGKTTLLETLARFIPIDSGSLTLNGQNVEEINPTAWRCKVILLPQTPISACATIREELSLAWSFAARNFESCPDESSFRAELDRIGLDSVKLDGPSTELSTGELARVSLLRALLPVPKVLLLDEPTANLDAGSAKEVIERISKFVEDGGAVLRIRHHADDGKANRSFKLENGKLI